MDPNVLKRITDEDRRAAKFEAIEEMKKIVIDDGIKEKTADQAKKFLTEFLDGLGYSSKIDFEGIKAK